jgi:hypothetical protein
VLCSIVSLELNGPWADEIQRRPEVETLLITGDNRNKVLTTVLAG